MALQPVNRRSVPEDVFEQIVADVLSGEMQPGQTLPSERRLAEVLGVPGRPCVRRSSVFRPPAWSRCARAIRPRCATSAARRPRPAPPAVAPRRRTRPLGRPKHPRGPVAQRTEGRRACRGTPPTGFGPLLDEAVRNLEAEHDPVERQRHALTFWDHVVDGADSIVFRLMYNTLRATYEPALPALAAVMAAEVGRPEAYRELADAIAAGDPDAAKRRRSTFSNPPPPRCSPR